MDDDGDGDDGSGLEGSADLADIISGSGDNATSEEAEDEEEEDDIPELVHMDEKYNNYYLPHILRLMSVVHSIVSLAMLFAYYHLKVSHPPQVYLFKKYKCTYTIATNSYFRKFLLIGAFGHFQTRKRNCETTGI